MNIGVCFHKWYYIITPCQDATHKSDDMFSTTNTNYYPFAWLPVPSGQIAFIGRILEGKLFIPTYTKEIYPLYVRIYSSHTYFINEGWFKAESVSENNICFEL